MQSAGQYGVAEVPQFLVGQPTPPHLFQLSHDMTLSPSSAHGHPGSHHAQQHLHVHHQHQHHLHHLQAAQQAAAAAAAAAQQQQQQQHHQQPHAPHPQQQHQIHQPSPHSAHTQHSQHAQHAQHAQAHAQHTQHAQHAQHTQHAQHAQHQLQQQQAAQQAQQAQQQAQQHAQQAQQQHAHQLSPHHQAQQQMVQQLGLGNPDSPEDPSPIASRQSPTGTFTKQMVAAQQEGLGHDALGQDGDGMDGDEGRSTGGGNRWPRQETLALIQIRSELDANFRDSGLKGPLWEEVSRKLAELGYSRNAKKCKEKFENIYKYYKKTKDGKAGRQDGKNYRFFSQLEAIYSSQHPSANNEGGATLLLAGVGHTVGPAGVDVCLSEQGGPAEQHSEGALPLETESSDDDYDEPTAVDAAEHLHEGSRKRKRKEGKDGGSSSKVAMFESLVKKLMDRQEEMQKKFLESIEKLEQDRLMREENWRRQETERLQREFQMRAHENGLAATREATLVAFLQKYTGQTVQLPAIPFPISTSVPDPAPAPTATVATPASAPSPVPATDNTPPTPIPASSVSVAEHQHLVPTPPTVSTHALAVVQAADTPQDDMEKDGSFDPNSKRWPKPEVQHLIRIRSSMETKFQEAGPKGPLWEEISTSMAVLGYSRNAKRCKEKWENINKYFRKTKESNKKRPENAKTCPYFHQLDSLYRSGELGTPVSKMKNFGKGGEDSKHRDDGDESGRMVQGGEMMALLPAPGGPAPASNGAGAHLFSSPENGSSAERGGSKKAAATR